MKERIDKVHFIKNLKFSFMKSNVKRMRREARAWEKTFTKYMIKGCCPKYTLLKI